MSGDDNKTSTQTQSMSLIPGQEAVLKRGFNEARDLFSDGKLYEPYTGSTVVPFSGSTQSGMRYADYYSRLLDTPLLQAFHRTSRFAGGDGFNDPQRDALAQLRKVSSGAYLDPNNNPGFASVLDQTQEAARDAVNMNAAGMGRTGSGVHQGVLADSIADATGSLLYQNYNTERGRQAAATGDLFNAGQQGIQNRFTANNALGGLYEAAMMPAQTRMAIGAMKEDLAAREMNDKLRIWQEKNDRRRRSIEWLMGIGAGAGTLGASRTTTAQAPEPSPFMTGLGGGIAGGTIGGPWGAAIGGGLGLLGGIF